MKTQKELNTYTTKQDFLRPTFIPEEVRKNVGQPTKEERDWHKATPAYTEKRLQEAVESGELVKVHTTDRIYVANTVEHPYVHPKFKALLEEVAERLQYIRPQDFLICVSLTRSYEQQYKSNPHLAKTSVHTKGEGADFPGVWYETYEPETAKVLKEILQTMQEEGKINFLEERHFAMWHISRKP